MFCFLGQLSSDSERGRVNKKTGRLKVSHMICLGKTETASEHSKGQNGADTTELTLVTELHQGEAFGGEAIRKFLMRGNHDNRIMPKINLPAYFNLVIFYQ